MQTLAPFSKLRTVTLDHKPRAYRLSQNANFAQVLSVSKLVRKETKGRLENEEWSAWRLGVARVLESTVYDRMMAAVVLANVVVMVFETNQNATCESTVCTPPALTVLNWIFMAIYALEVSVRLAVYRLRAFCDSWTVVDIVVVVMGIIEMTLSTHAQTNNMPKTSSLKTVRVFRLMRAMKFVQYVPALQGIARGFASAMSSMFWGILAIMSLVFLVSIATVELVHPVAENLDFGPGNNDWCQSAFSSVQLTMLFFTQTVIAGDSWGACVVPLSRYSAGFWLMFTGVTVVVQLGLMNLILSSIVEDSNKAHESDLEARGRELHGQDLKNIQVLGEIFSQIDADGTGTLSESEFLTAYDSNPDMQKLFKLLNIARVNLIPLFRMMDQDKSGTINYDEFLTTMRDAQLTDFRMQLMTVKLQSAHAIQLLEKVRGIPKRLPNMGCPFSESSSGGDEEGVIARQSPMSASESSCDPVSKAAVDETRVTPNTALSRAKKASLRASGGAPDHGDKVLSCARAEGSEPCADAEELPVVDGGSGPALDDDSKTFLDTVLANLDEELRKFGKSLRHQVEAVIASTLSTAVPFNNLSPIIGAVVLSTCKTLLSARYENDGHDWDMEEFGDCRPCLPSPPLQAASPEALAVLREPSRAAPGAVDAAGVTELAEEVNLLRVSTEHRLPRSIL